MSHEFCDDSKSQTILVIVSHGMNVTAVQGQHKIAGYLGRELHIWEEQVDSVKDLPCTVPDPMKP